MPRAPDGKWLGTGNPRGRPKKGTSTSELARARLEAKDPATRKQMKLLVVDRLLDICIHGEDDDATRAIQVLIRATEGDKLNVNPAWNPDDWHAPAEDAEPIPAPRFVTNGNGSE